jgi:hypothetical protein
MTDDYSGIPELSADAKAIARRRKIAESMMAQSQTPLETNQMAGGYVVPVSWTQGLAKIAQAYLANKTDTEADKAERGLADKRQQMVADQLMKAQQISQGTPAIEGIQAQPERTIQAPAPMQQGQVAPNYGTVPEIVPAVAGREAVPAVAGDKRRANEMLVASSFPEIQRIVAQRNAWDTQDATLQAKQAENQADRDLKISQFDKEIAYRKQNGQETRDLEMARANLASEDRRYQADVMSADRRYQTSQASADRRYTADQKSPIQITDEAGNVKLVDYQGNLVKDLGKVGKPTGGYQKVEISKKKMSSDLDLTIKELEDASKDGGLIDKSTGSGAGALVDYAADFVGTATPGSIAVGEMKPIYDMALKMVPRFEGPQSDKDTKTYADAAGDLANPRVPNDRKKAAAKTIVRLMKQRKGQFIDKANEGTELDAKFNAGTQPRVVDW